MVDNIFIVNNNISMKLTNSLKKIIFEAFSQKLIQTLVDKFSQETKDSKDTIMSLISSFEKYQQGLPVDKRDITKYSYNDLKKLIESKKVKKELEVFFTRMKKTNENVNDGILAKNIKKFYEIKSELPSDRRNVTDYTYLGLDRFIEDNYEKLLLKKYVPIFRKEDPNTSEETIKGYLTNYISSYDEIPNRTTPINFLSFIDLEHLVDSVAAKKDVGVENKVKDYSDVDLVYDNDNQIVIRPLTKEQCIKYKRGRGWCITWLGGNNRYYFYRLDRNRTIYYSIDEDLPYEDRNHILVILVGPDGSKYVADKTNSAPNHGDTITSWKTITEKQPKLAGLEHLFKPVKLSEYEENIIKNVRKKRVGDDPKKEFDTYEMLEIWVELLDTSLTDVQYGNLPIDLKKKYIASGFDLTPGQIGNSETAVLNYYIKKKIDNLKNTSLSSLSESEIKLLNTPSLASLKMELKPRFTAQLGTQTVKSAKLEITYPNSTMSKYISLYGFDTLLDDLPDNLIHLGFENKSDNYITVKLPNDIGKLHNLTSLYLEKCVDSIPDSVGNLEKLVYLSLPNNPKLTNLPDSVYNLPSLKVLRIEGTNIQIPEKYREMFKETRAGSNFWRKL